MLLYIAVLQQAAICYDFLSASLSRAEHHSLQLRLGSFETHIEMDRDIYGMVLSMEIKRAIKVVIRLYDTLQLGGAENVLEEVKYQQELVETLRGDLEQLLNRTT